MLFLQHNVTSRNFVAATWKFSSFSFRDRFDIFQVWIARWVIVTTPARAVYLPLVRGWRASIGKRLTSMTWQKRC